MRSYRFVIASLALLGLFVALPTISPALAAEKIKTITVATDATWPPMEMVDDQQEDRRLRYRLLTAVAKEAGFTVDFKNTAWDGIFAGLEAGKYDAIVSSVTITDERKKTWTFSDPYINAGQILVVPKTAKAGRPWPTSRGRRWAPRSARRAPSRSRRRRRGAEDLRRDRPGLRGHGGRPHRRPWSATTRRRPLRPAAEGVQGKFKIVGQPFTEESYGCRREEGQQGARRPAEQGHRGRQGQGDRRAARKKWLR